MCEQNASYLVIEVLGIRVKKFKQTLTEKCSKSTKIAISLQQVIFQNFPGGAIPPDAPKAFSVFQSALISSAEKTCLKKMVKLCPPPFLKFFATSLRCPMNNKYGPVFATLSCCLGSEFRQNCRQKHPPPVKILYFAHWWCA